MCVKMREAAETKTRKMTVGASRVVDVMENTNLPQLHKDWTVEEASLQSEEDDRVYDLQVC